jgi:hypothetical protein
VITAVVPTSPIPSHPDTAILEETLDSIRHHLPDVEIILTFDGVRPETEDRRGDYEEYIRRALWLADHKYGNVCPLVFDDHRHQTGMMRAALAEIRTPLLIYVEHDTPLVVDELIDWHSVLHFVPTNGVVRFHHEARTPDEHQHMMHGRAVVTTSFRQAGFERTSQWSQRPHVAATAFYRRIMDSCFSPDARSFIEDKMHGVCDEAYRIDGLNGWSQYPLWIYHPDGGNIKRSYHLDGRCGAEKYEEAQIF